MACIIFPYIVVVSIIIPAQKYNNATKLYDAKEYQAAATVFASLDGYKDSANMVLESQYQDAILLFNNRQYDKAIAAFEPICEYKDSETKLAVCYNRRYIEKYGEETYNRIKTSEIGDILTFGKYAQDNSRSNRNEKIEWVIVDKVDGALLLVSVKVLDSRPYNTSRTSVTWEDCSLRRWLNNDFLNWGFSLEEQALIQDISDDKYSTSDKVFLLDGDNYLMYEYGDGELRRCFPTEFAKSKGVFYSNNEGTCWWLLRWPDSTDIVPIVDSDGNYYYDGCYVDEKMGIRPAMWIKLVSEVAE